MAAIISAVLSFLMILEAMISSFMRAVLPASEPRVSEEEDEASAEGRDCAICLGGIGRSAAEICGKDTVLRCGHLFHERCFEGWAKIRSEGRKKMRMEKKGSAAAATCPLCRASVNGGRGSSVGSNVITVSPFSSESRVRDLCWIR